MEAKDKRLIVKMDLLQQQKYFEKMDKHVLDAADKFEESEITHEPINLLNRIKSKKIKGKKPPVSLEQIDENET